MKLEILVGRVSPDEGVIVDENERQWDMVEVRQTESREPYWQIETRVRGRLIQGTFDDVAIYVSSWNEIARYMEP
jgi:hypothetical protein